MNQHETKPQTTKFPVAEISATEVTYFYYPPVICPLCFREMIAGSRNEQRTISCVDNPHAVRGCPNAGKQFYAPKIELKLVPVETNE